MSPTFSDACHVIHFSTWYSLFTRKHACHTRRRYRVTRSPAPLALAGWLAGWAGAAPLCAERVAASLRRCSLLAASLVVEVTSLISLNLPHPSPKMFASAVRRNALKGLIPPKIATPSAVVRIESFGRQHPERPKTNDRTLC